MLEQPSYEEGILPAQIYYGGQKDFESGSENESKKVKVVQKENRKVYPEEEELDATGMQLANAQKSDMDLQQDSLCDIGLNFKEKVKQKNQKQQKFQSYISDMQNLEGLDYDAKARDKKYKELKRQTNDIL